MKVIAAFLLIVGISLCNGQGLSFLEDNVLTPFLQNVQQNALALLQSQLATLLGGLFNFGKRSLDTNQLLQSLVTPLIEQLRQIYHQLFVKFNEIYENIASYIFKPDFARIELIQAGVNAENALSRLAAADTMFKPIFSLVQQHLGLLINQLEQFVAGIFQPGPVIQPLIGTGSLLLP